MPDNSTLLQPAGCRPGSRDRTVLPLIPLPDEGGGAERAQRQSNPSRNSPTCFADYLTEKAVPPRQVDQLRQTLDELLAETDRERIRASASSLATSVQAGHLGRATPARTLTQPGLIPARPGMTGP
jgi:hypothetical protein